MRYRVNYNTRDNTWNVVADHGPNFKPPEVEILVPCQLVTLEDGKGWLVVEGEAEEHEDKVVIR